MPFSKIDVYLGRILPNRPDVGPPVPAFLDIRWPITKRVKGVKQKYGVEGYVQYYYEDDILGGHYTAQEYHLDKTAVDKRRANEIAVSLQQYGYTLINKPRDAGDEWIFKVRD